MSRAVAGASGSLSTALSAGRTLPALGPWLLLGLAGALALAASRSTGAGLFLVAVTAAAAATVVVYVWSRAVEGPRRAADRAVTIAVAAAFVLAVLPLASLLFTVVERGVARFDITFFTETQRNVVGAGGGALHAIVGTLLITGIATLVSVPIGILAAIFLQEYGRGMLARALTFFVDVMTGIPSIVAGLFAFALFALFFGPGIRLGVMGSVALTILMIPIVVRSTEEMLRIVPNALREGSYALGASKWRTVTTVVVPAALGGIVTGVMLAIARIVGETAPLLVTTGVVASMNTDPFEGRMHNLAVYAFNEYKFPGAPADPYIDRAWTAALTLITIVMLLNLFARFVYRRFGTVGG